MERKIVRVKDGEWCSLELRLENGRLSICGSAGHVATRAQAKRMAIESWISYFEEDEREIASMRKRYGRTVLVMHSCGQIREELLAWFPEVAPYLKWHLNDMRAECEHQEARGETWTTHPSAVCPDCGYSLGSAWKKRELPADVEQWVRAFGVEGEEACA